MYPFNHDSVIAMKGVLQPPLFRICWSINGTFHRLSLVAAGDMLLPFSRYILDTGFGDLVVSTLLAVGLGIGAVVECS